MDIKPRAKPREAGEVAPGLGVHNSGHRAHHGTISSRSPRSAWPTPPSAPAVNTSAEPRLRLLRPPLHPACRPRSAPEPPWTGGLAARRSRKRRGCIQVSARPERGEQAAGNWRTSWLRCERRTDREGSRSNPTSPRPAAGTPRSTVSPSAPRATASCAATRRASAARQGRGHCVRLPRPLALDRIAHAHFGAAHPDLPRAARAIRPELDAPSRSPDLALAQAKQADPEIAAGRYRGPLHGIPWGAKDLVDTAGNPTTYGAEPFRNRVPARTPRWWSGWRRPAQCWWPS